MQSKLSHRFTSVCVYVVCVVTAKYAVLSEYYGTSLAPSGDNIRKNLLSLLSIHVHQLMSHGGLGIEPHIQLVLLSVPRPS